MHELAPYLLAGLGAILFWGAKMIVKAISDLSVEMKQLRGELSAHHASTVQRLSVIETSVEAIKKDIDDIDERLRAVERKRA